MAEPKGTSSDEIRDTALSEALSERYLAYALSTIVSRSLPDVRDGLKPVHRRLLFAMRQLRLDPASGFKKCARVVGDVIGKYHPHGDTAVYDALVRLAQDFAVRYPLVEGQGNFGNIDGDNPAAMRYTEARLTAYAQALMDGLDENAVDFRPTYDGEDAEPVVMPAAVPNLLGNGATGIAVGMATSIPPHNVGEICDALLHLIKKPSAESAELLEFMPGPDFPTGGVIAESPDVIRTAYETGRGGIRVRARWRVEKLSHGLFQVVIAEIPFQVQKAKLIERIAELLHARKLPLLADIRDESTEEVRIVLDPRSRSVDPEQLMAHLFRQTELETRIAINMNVIDGEGVPRVMTLKEILQAFIDHRHEVLVRRAEHRLGKIAHRLEVLDGYLVAYLNLDEVIAIIRNHDEPKPVLMTTFSLSDVQAEAILNMRLRALRKLEEEEIRGEHARLSAEQAELKALLSDEKARFKAIAGQIRNVRKQFGAETALGRRRTDFDSAPSAEIVPIEAMIEKEPVTVILSEKGWIRAMKGHVEDLSGVRFKDEDALRLSRFAQTTDRILLFASNGRFYSIPADRLPRGRGFGEPVRLMTDLPNDADIVAMTVHRPEGKLLVASKSGRGFVVPESDVLAQTRGGKQVMNARPEDPAAFCIPADGDTVACIGENRKLLLFPISEVPEMARGRGVILQRHKSGGLSDVAVIAWQDGLAWKSGGGTRRVGPEELRSWLGKRAQVGFLPPAGFPKSNRFGA